MRRQVTPKTETTYLFNLLGLSPNISACNSIQRFLCNFSNTDAYQPWQYQQKQIMEWIIPFCCKSLASSRSARYSFSYRVVFSKLFSSYPWSSIVKPLPLPRTKSVLSAARIWLVTTACTSSFIRLSITRCLKASVFHVTSSMRSISRLTVFETD